MLNRFGPGEILIIVVLLIVIFGWKRLPDAARSLGRSARVFKSEVDEMKNDGKDQKSSTTVPGETVHHEADPTARPSTPTPSPIREDVPSTDNPSGDQTRKIV